jgi:hypothetical protein
VGLRNERSPTVILSLPKRTALLFFIHFSFAISSTALLSLAYRPIIRRPDYNLYAETGLTYLLALIGEAFASSLPSR